MKEKTEAKLVLLTPTIEYKKQVLNYRETFLNDGESFDGCACLEECNTYEEWIDFDARLSNKYGNNFVPSKIFLAIRKSDNKLVGIIDIRLHLNDFLYKYGGHIGYSVLPEERQKGYAKEMLKLALIECSNLHIDRVLITCDKNNTASKNVIIANRGILENEVQSEDGITQRYWISLKKRYADRHINDDADIEIKSISVQDDYFKGDIYFCGFTNVKEKRVLANGTLIIDNNYKWLEFYNYSAKLKLTAIYNDKNEIVEWYFDIARKIGKDDGVPYEDDLYLDVVVLPSGEIYLIDQDELEEAYQKKYLTKEEYQVAYNEANELIKKLEGNVEKLREYTNNYLHFF